MSIVRRDGPAVRLFTRRGYDWTERYAALDNGQINWPALREILGNRIDFYFAPILSAVPLIESRELRGLAVSSLTRSDVLPDIPTTLEAGYPDFDYVFWIGLFAPAATSRDIIARLYDAAAKALDDKTVGDNLRKLGAAPILMVSSNLVGWVTGRSAGFSPRRMRLVRWCPSVQVDDFVAKGTGSTSFPLSSGCDGRTVVAVKSAYLVRPWQRGCTKQSITRPRQGQTKCEIGSFPDATCSRHRRCWRPATVFPEPLKAAAPEPTAVSPAMIEAARKEGMVAFYTAMEIPVAENLGKAFEAKYPGIAVHVKRSGAERVFQRIGKEEEIQHL